MEYVSYIRVSTKKQGRSGLGLEAQKEINANYAESVGGSIVAEFSDVESGSHCDRPGLLDALDFCKKHGSTLLVAKLDRLARDAAFTMSLHKSGVNIHIVDMPCVNTLTIGIFAVIAEYERELGKNRSAAAREVARSKGVKFGAPDPKFTDEQREKAVEVRKKKAERRSTQYIDLIEMYRAKGLTLQAIADKLNAKKFKTPRGKEFAPATISMYLKRIEAE